MLLLSFPFVFLSNGLVLFLPHLLIREIRLHQWRGGRVGTKRTSGSASHRWPHSSCRTSPTTRTSSRFERCLIPVATLARNSGHSRWIAGVGADPQASRPGHRQHQGCAGVKGDAACPRYGPAGDENLPTVALLIPQSPTSCRPRRTGWCCVNGATSAQLLQARNGF